MAIDTLGNNVRFVVLCASDPYAVVGVQTAFGIRPDLVTGPATNTSAGIELVRKLTGLTALNLIDPASLPDLRNLLQQALHLALWVSASGLVPVLIDAQSGPSFV